MRCRPASIRSLRSCSVARSSRAGSRPVSEATPKKKRRWLRRLLVALLLVILAVRIGGQMALPKVASELAAKAGLAIAWERLDLSLLGGSFELYEVDLR